MKEEISGALDELEFLRNIHWMVGIWIDRFISAQIIPAALSCLLCTSFAPLVEDKKQDTGKIYSNFKIDFRIVRKHIHGKVRELYCYNRPHRLPIRDDMDNPSKIIDHRVLDFFDRVISKLRKQCISSDNQMETAIQELSYLRCNLLDVLQLYSQGGSGMKDMDSLGLSALDIIVETACQTYFPGLNGSNGTAENRLTHLIENVDSLKLQASNFFSGYKIYSLASSSSAPRNCTDSVKCLIKNIEEQSNHRAASISLLKPQIETYYREIQPLREFFGSQIENDLIANSQMAFFIERFNELTCKSSTIIDSFLRGEGSIWYHKLGLFVITNAVKVTYPKMKWKLQMMKSTVDDVSIKSGLIPSVVENPSEDFNTAASSKNEMRVMNSNDEPAHVKLVGVKDAANEIIELLTRGTTNLQIVSIVGMPGLGKTTMANYAYEHQSVSLHFHVRAWCCISQFYSKESLLADLLSQVVGETKTSLEEVTVDGLADMLRRQLKGKRYLIVIDDIWDADEWRALQETFPNDKTQSRVLFTTRHLDVAREVNSVRYNLRLLSDIESCKLFWFKVFDKETCPFPELLITSRRIARECKGLPLALVLVAGILRNIERRKQCWEQVAATVKSLQGKHGNHHPELIQFRYILELSYTNLPARLRPCFLYFAAFAEDTSISVSKLMELWISEGFVHEQNICGKCLKEEAKSYLDELIDRSLVMITKKSSNGGAKACRIHDALRDFCLEKSKQNDVMLSMFGGIIRLQQCSLIYDNLPNRNINPGMEQEVENGERLTDPPIFTNNLDPHVGAVTVGFFNPATIKLDDDFTYRNRFLKVLDLGKVRIQSSADTSDIITIATLVHLRFLGIRPRTNEIPAKIGNLLKLETLILTGVIGLVMIPESLWKLSRLRNILMDHGFFSFQFCSQDFVEKLSQLYYDLKSVSTLLLRSGGHAESFFLRRSPNLQKLACRFVYSGDNAEGICIFPSLDFLNQLKSLKLFFSGVARYPCQFSFPSSLKKLSLSNSRLPWVAISVIMEQLPNLEVLKLLSKAFEGQQWDIGNCEILFPKLKFLKLDSLDIQVWNAMDEPFPCLEQLVVLSCPQLEEIPSCFGEIPTLQSIEMKWCSSSAMESVRQILRDQRDLSNNDLEVTLIGS